MSFTPQAPPPPPPPFEPLSFGSHPLQSLYRFTPPGPIGATIVFIHGGAFRHPPLPPDYSCSSRSGLSLLTELHKKFPQCQLASLDYRLLKHPRLGCIEPAATSWKECLADVETGLRALGLDSKAGEEKVNGRDVIFIGHSVGAFLAGKVKSLVENSQRKVRVIGVEGCYDFVNLVAEYGPDAQWVLDAMGPEEKTPGDWKVDVDVKIWSKEDELLSVRQLELGEAQKIVLEKGSHDGVLNTESFVQVVVGLVEQMLRP